MTFKNWKSLKIGDWNLIRLVRVSDGAVLFEKQVGPELEDGFHVWIHAEAGVSYAPYNIRPSDGTYTIDWGDGTVETKTGQAAAGSRPTAHTYAETGDYKLSLSCSGIAGYTRATTYYSWFDYKTTDTYTVRSVTAKSDTQLTGFNARAFYRDRALSSVIIDDSCVNFKTIPTGCFASCDNLSYVQLPPSVTSLTSTQFTGCDGINMDLRGTTGRTVSTTSADTFGSNCNLSVHQAPNYMLSKVTSKNLKVTFMPEVSSIGSQFGLSSGITEVVFPNGTDNIQKIGAQAFSYTNVSGDYAFTNLTSVGSSLFRGTNNKVRLSVDFATPMKMPYFTEYDLEKYHIGKNVTNFTTVVKNTKTVEVDPENTYLPKLYPGERNIIKRSNGSWVCAVGYDDPAVRDSNFAGNAGVFTESPNLHKLTILGTYRVALCYKATDSNHTFDADAQISVYVDPSMVSQYQADAGWASYPGIKIFPIEETT